MSDKKRLWLVLGTCLLLAGGIGALAYMDRREVEAIEADIASLDTRIAAADVEIKKTKPREDEVLVFRAVQPRELEILPREQQIADFHSNLTTFLQQAGARFRKLPENTSKPSELAKDVFVTPNTLEFEADAVALLKLINIIEIDPRLTAVKGLKVKSGGRRVGRDGPSPVHKATLNLETYFYKPTAGGRAPVAIANEAERLEEPTLKARIASFQPERRDTYTLRPSSSRRDPFIDFRKEVVVEDPEEVRKRFEAEETITVDLEKRYDEIREKLEEEKALATSGNLFVRDRVARELDGVLNELRVRVANVASVKSVTFADLLARVERVRAEVESVAATRKDLPRDLTVTAVVAREVKDQIDAALGKGDYAEVTSLSVAWEQFLRGKAIEEAAYPAIEQIKGLRHKAKALAEFEALALEVTAVMVNPDDAAASVALVNGKAVRQGDRVGAKGEVEVAKIGRSGVEFDYLGVSIFRTRAEGGGVSGTGASRPAAARGTGAASRAPARPSVTPEKGR